MIAKFCMISLCITTALSVQVEIIKQWNLLNFHCPYNNFEFVRNFRPNETVVTGLEVTENRIFIGMPRIYTGLPATLAYIPYRSPTTNPALHAYPNWAFHDLGRGVNVSCDGLASVYRFKIDSCQRLWVLDSGYVNSNEKFERSCPPKIAIFDLRTDQLVRTVLIPNQVLRANSLLTNLIIDESVQGPCDSAFVYISDTDASGLIVYDAMRNTAWRFMHPSMFPDPDFAETTINGESIGLMDGIVGLAHSPKLGILYYQPLASAGTYSVPTAALRRGPPGTFDVLPVSLVGRKSSTGLALVVNRKDESLIYSPFTETSIRSWNPLNNNQRLLASDPEKLQFVCDMKWIENDGSIWILSSRFHKFFRRSVDPRDINIRVMRIV